MTYADLQRLQWAVHRSEYLKKHPQHPDSWKQPIYQYELIPDILREHQAAILKSLEQTIKPPPNHDFKL